MAKMKDGRICIAVDDYATLKEFAYHAIVQGVETLANLDGGASRHLVYGGALAFREEWERQRRVVDYVRRLGADAVPALA